MGRIPTSTNQLKPIPTTIGGPGKGFGMQAINVQGSVGQDYARAGQTVGSIIDSAGKVIKAKGKERLTLATHADSAEFERRREDFKNAYVEESSKTKDTDAIKKNYDDYVKNVEGLLKPGAVDPDTKIPYFRTRKSYEDSKNFWSENVGDEKAANNKYLRELNREESFNRIESSDFSVIKNSKSYFDELANKKIIIANADELYNNGMISKAERNIRIKDKTAKLTDSSINNKLAYMDSNISTPEIFKEQLVFFNEQVNGRKDLTDVQKKTFTDRGVKLLKAKENNQKADENEQKVVKQNLWRDNAFKIMGNIRDDGSLPITNNELRTMVANGEISPEFASNIISGRAKSQAKIDIATAKYEEKEKLINDYGNLWSDIQNYDPTKDAGKEEFAILNMRIAPYSDQYSVALVNELKTKVMVESKKPVDKANSEVMKGLDNELRTLIGIGSYTKDGKKKFLKPSVESTFKTEVDWGIDKLMPYEDRLKLFNKIKTDIMEKAKTASPHELQEYIENNNVIKKVRSDVQSGGFFSNYLNLHRYRKNETEADKKQQVYTNKKTGKRVIVVNGIITKEF